MKQAENIIDAARHAGITGIPLNRHITIHWELAGIGDAEAAAATGQFLKLATDWVRTRGGRYAYLWVRENGSHKGSHVHILAHIPQGLSFGPLQRGWLRLITRRPYVPRTIYTRPVGGRINAAATAPEVYEKNLWEVLSYLTKGASPETVSALRLTKGCEPGGTIVGKRAGWSQCLGEAARLKSI